MTIVAHAHPFVIGVDTHARTHTFAILVAATGELIATEQFPATDAGMDRAVAWAARRTDGELATLWVIEGVATYGARLASTVKPSRLRGCGGGSRWTHGPIAVPASPIRWTPAGSLPRSCPSRLNSCAGREATTASGLHCGFCVTARAHMTTERTATINALTALLRVADLGIDARKPLTAKQISEVARWRTRSRRSRHGTARAEAVRLAKRVVDLDEELTANQAQMIRPHPCQQGRCIAGQDRHRPSHRRGRLRRLVARRPGPFRGGLRGLSWRQPHPRLLGKHHPSPTQPRRRQAAQPCPAHGRHHPHDPRPRNPAYVERRRAEGRTTKEIRRCLKRYLARHLYRTLESTPR